MISNSLPPLSDVSRGSSPQPLSIASDSLSKASDQGEMHLSVGSVSYAAQDVTSQHDHTNNQLVVTVSSDGIRSASVDHSCSKDSVSEHSGGDNSDNKSSGSRKMPMRMKSMLEFRDLAADKMDDKSKVKQFRKSSSRFTLGKKEEALKHWPFPRHRSVWRYFCLLTHGAGAAGGGWRAGGWMGRGMER